MRFAPASGDSAVARTGPPPRPHVLLAESDEITARTVRHRLQRDGVDLATAVDGPEALGLLDAVRFDAAVVDTELTGADGLDLLRQIRAGRFGASALPVVVLAWPGNDATVARAYDLDADDVLVRPLSLVALSASVRRLTRRAR